MRLPRIYLSAPHMGGNELRLVEDVFASNWLSTVGPHITALEQEFDVFTAASCLALSSGTSAIHLGLKLLDVSAGDEVVVPTLSFVATSNPVRYEQAFPTFVDSERRTWNIDPNLLADLLQRRARVNRLPAAVIVVHLFGQSADTAAILRICSEYEVPVLEDAANALGALNNGRPLGTAGALGIYSLGGNKIITATTGGILVSRSREQIEKARHWSTQARDTDPEAVGNYVHSEVGYNYRMSNVLAAIGSAQLKLLEERVQQRRTVFQRYADAFRDLPGIEPQPECIFGPGASRHNRWLSCFLVDPAAFGLNSTQLIRHLASLNIESRPVWKPMHLQPLYAGFERFGGSVAEDLHSRGICLPSSSSLTLEEQQRVIDAVHEAHLNASSHAAFFLDKHSKQ